MKTKCIWDNFETIHITSGEVRDLIVQCAKSKLTDKQKIELVPAYIEVCDGGICDSISGNFKVSFCEPEFVKECKRKRKYEF